LCDKCGGFWYTSLLPLWEVWRSGRNNPACLGCVA